MPAFFRAVEKLKPVYDWTYKIVLFICKLLLIGDIAVTAWSVAGPVATSNFKQVETYNLCVPGNTESLTLMNPW